MHSALPQAMVICYANHTERINPFPTALIATAQQIEICNAVWCIVTERFLGRFIPHRARVGVKRPCASN